jgi:hypothetical protein
MQPKRSLIYILAALIALPLFEPVASATTIDIIQTFDFPAATATLPQKISDQLDLVGTTIGTDGKLRAFVYKVRAQRFSPRLNAPLDTGGVTQGRGINSKRLTCGEYLKQDDGTLHGYTMVSGVNNTVVFTSYDLTGALQTIPLGINNFKSLAGSAVFSDGTQPAFVTLVKSVTTFAVPDATATFAYMVNSSNQAIGYYLDSAGVAHGFTRDSLGVLAYPIDVAGATETLLLGNNDSNWGVGRYTDASGVTHGLFYVTPDDILTYDFPGGTYTSLNGINKDGLICGYYLDTAGVAHGLVVRVNLTAGGKPNTNTWTAPVKPAYTLPKVPGIALPAL